MSAWIKMRTDLRDHPKVVRMASATKSDTLRIIGALWAVWSAFDTHSVDGMLEGYSLATIDEKTFRGFGKAMVAVRWLEETEDGLIVPEFDEHNGASAKRRATETKRVATNRKADKGAHGSWDASEQMSASNADNSRTRVRLEKEKEKEIQGAPPDATTLRAPVHETEPPKASPAQGSGTAYGLAALAMRQQGMGDAHPGDPRLRALVDAETSIEEFQSMAREAVDKGKRFPWALAALANRRAEAAAAPIAAKPAAADTATNPDVAATARRLAEESARVIAKPPAELLARRSARHAGEPS